jgi:hypothetical protein
MEDDMKETAMSAVDVVRGWIDLLAPGQWLPGILSATQSGTTKHNPTILAVPLVAFTRSAEGGLEVRAASIVFADRKASIPDRPIQPFDASKADKSTFTITPSAVLVEHSTTWGFTQQINLQEAGNGLLSGWGGSIGNTGAPAFWVVGIAPRPARTPG